MRKKIKTKVSGRQRQALREAAFEMQVRQDSASQIMTAAAQVLIGDYGFTQDQCVEFGEKVVKHIRQNNAVLRGGQAAWAEEGTAAPEALTAVEGDA
jgi:hypothetical protein